MTGANVGVGNWIRLSFEEIPDSKNKTYHFSVSSPSSTKENALGIHTDEKGKPSLITYHKINSYHTIVGDIYSQFFQKLLKDKLFLIYWFTILFFLSFLLSSNVYPNLRTLNSLRK